MLRRAKLDDNTSKNEVEPRGSLYILSMEENLYRQYYLIGSNTGFRAIAEYYSTDVPGDPDHGQFCANDIENIYIISDHYLYYLRSY